MRITRRQLMHGAILSALPAGLPGSLVTAQDDGRRPLSLRMAGYPFDHVRGIVDGKVAIDGCNVVFATGKISDLNTDTFSGPQTYDVTEIGLMPYLLAWSNDDFRDYPLLPVFPLRTFRHKSIFIHADSGIKKPEDLQGRRVGTPGYSSTSLTWIRGMLSDEHGVTPEDIDWVVSAEDSAANVSGRRSAQEMAVPDGISISTGPAGKDESDLLVEREVDALFHAAEPRAFVEGHPKVRRLFEDPRATEQAYFDRTGIFPIMHTVAMRGDLLEREPWLAKAVFDAYVTAKQLSYTDMRNNWALRTLPWFAQELDSTQALMGVNFFPYGIEQNRKALDTLCRYAFEQGLATKRVAVDDLFSPAMSALSGA